MANTEPEAHDKTKEKDLVLHTQGQSDPNSKQKRRTELLGAGLRMLRIVGWQGQVHGTKTQ